VLWFDGGWEHSAADHHAKRWSALIRHLQPAIVINDRIKPPAGLLDPRADDPGDRLPGRDWETCMTMNDTWGFKASDTELEVDRRRC